MGILKLRRWDFGLVPSERSLEAVGKSVRLHIIGRSKVFDLFPRTHKGKNRRVLREKHALINSRERTQKSDINLEQSSQQESESLSANVRLGLQFRYQQGKVQVNHNWFLGYTKDEDGHLIIDQEQAEVVKRIYREYLSGNSLLKIKRSLEADGVLNGAGRGEWNETNIKQILTNEKYIGDALLQKTYTVDILEGAPITDLAVQMLAEIRNSGDIHQYKVYAHHNAKGIPMYSATLPIIGENNRIIGLLCMNFHTEISLCDMLHGFLNHNNDKKNDLLVETYTNN
ncbi:recombinase family protein [Clostridiales bacterium BAD-6]|uniref:Recombinase family protein n=1 Tax=Sinanaerobacter chloroacetimidivorans TaxID=2818044 RepID=A0A8J7W2X5_9FIRM|nr:recombinase family protein [Sinanaerobacter chloroacetimidivorans]